MLQEVIFCMVLLAALAAFGQEKPAVRAWWQKSGLGIQYQIEQRPGWKWERNFVKFNRSMTDENGNLKFNGPFCQVPEFVELSRKVGVDYHMLETKWHDGICYFNTQLTSWKTPEDYVGQFAKLSRAAGIPFVFYYSTIFDHNPKFNRIQPIRFSTVSPLGMVPGHIYTNYLAGQFQELIEQYHPDGLWLDWYMPWPDKSSSFSIKYLQQHYPEVIVSCNSSNAMAGARKKLNYTSGEAHGLNQVRPEFDSVTNFVGSLFGNAWKMANNYRWKFDQPWELCSPCGKNWQDPELREDLQTLARMSAVVMANGGKSLIGVGTELSGETMPDHVKQMEYIGEWYKPRKTLFTEATPLKYSGDRPPGVTGYPKDFGAVAAKSGNDVLLHLLNFTSAKGPVTLQFQGEPWRGAKKVYLEPTHQELAFANNQITLARDQIDPIDTIIRLKDLYR